MWRKTRKEAIELNEVVSDERAEWAREAEEEDATRLEKLGLTTHHPDQHGKKAKAGKQLSEVLDAGGASASSDQAGTQVPTSSVFDSLQQEKQVAPGEEPWRCRRVARGVPKDDSPKPRSQDVANTELDTARLLTERGNILEVPDMPEENQLKRMLAKKTEWLYSPKESAILNTKRHTILQMVTEQAKTQAWTLAGRLVCGIGDRPPTKSVNLPPPLPPHLLKARTPMTRTEVTEQRLIENACRRPAPPPQFTLEAAKLPSRDRRGARPWSARGSGNMFSEHGRVLVESPQAPLTAR
jgi:hypothetical protein